MSFLSPSHSQAGKKNLKNRFKKNLSKGFTLIELIVVLAIFAIITGIALADQGNLNSNILVSNLAYEIGLSIRQAQSYGVGVRAVSTTGGFDGAYGVSFDVSKPNRIILFNDLNGDNLYEDGEEDSELQVVNQQGNKIVATCVELDPGQKCTKDTGVGLLTITFKRPNPEAVFTRASVDSDGNIIDGTMVNNATGPAYIVVNTASGNNCRVVTIQSTGQVSVSDVTGGICVNSGS
jgi:prepilin-type N-terminal cleavage/methylation domain-containing protein